MFTKEEVNCCVKESGVYKAFVSPSYNYIYNKSNGNFCRWGKTKDDDPLFAPAPELLDLEISTGGCPGVNGKVCKFCYKNNGPDNPQNMTFAEFKNIIDKFSKSLTQIAFGITGVQTNPDFIPMMKYAKKIGITPNFTLSGSDLTSGLADEIASIVGGLAVSVYDTDPNVCYNTVKMFTDRGIKQTNIHLMISQETLEFSYRVGEDIKNDERLAELNAVVLLGVKPKGRARGAFKSLSQQDFNGLCKRFIEDDINIGFDSCNAPKFDNFAKTYFSKEQSEMAEMLSESCESTLFSSYINSKGIFFPCSFCEGEQEWNKGINVLEVEDFVRDVWFNERTVEWRNKLLGGCVNGVRRCPVFDEVNP